MALFKLGSGKLIPILDFAPDAPNNTPGIILDLVGGYPSASGFRPLPSLVPVGAALPGRVLGSFFAYYSDTTFKLFAAYDTGSGVVFKVLNPASRLWDTVTGLTVNPALPVRFCQFGDDVMAVGGFGSIALAAAKGSNFVSISGSPAGATVICSVNLQVLVFVGDRWHSCAVGNNLLWTPDIATLAATGILYHAPGPVTGAVPFYDKAIVCKKNATLLGQQIGPPHSWGFELISSETGTWGQGCMVQLPDRVVWVGIDDFYECMGYAPTRIPNNCKEWFFREADAQYLPYIQGWYDQSNSIVYWHFVSRQAPDPPTCDRYVTYNVRAKRWGVGRLDVASTPYLGTASSEVISGYGEGQYGLGPYGGVGSLSDAADLIIDGTFTPKTFRGEASAMVLTTGYHGDGNYQYQLQRIMPIYNTAPEVEVIVPFHTSQMGRPDVRTAQAIQAPSGWHWTKQTDRYHRWALQTAGEAEVIGFIPEGRQAGFK